MGLVFIPFTYILIIHCNTFRIHATPLNTYKITIYHYKGTKVPMILGERIERKTNLKILPVSHRRCCKRSQTSHDTA